MTEREALDWLLDHREDTDQSLRAFLEEELPRQARRLDVETGDYFEVMTALLEERAEQKGIDPLVIYTDRELVKLAE